MSHLPTAVFDYLSEHWPAHLARTQTFLRQPSVSAQNRGVRETADLLRGWLNERGARVEYFGRPSHPIVYAEWDVGAPKTLLVYGMYDVQPVDDQVWTTPPFAAEIWDHPAGGQSLVARGACNSKGPLMAFLHVIEAYRAAGGLPVNIKWTIEGEEEIGSLELPRFYESHRDRLRADAAFEPFWGQEYAGARPHLILGTKGVLGLEFISRSAAWGGPREVVHSSVGSWVASPAWRLVQALNTLVDESQELAVNGIPPLGEISDSDDDLLRAMAGDFNVQATLERLGTTRFKRDLPPFHLLRQIQFAPVLNINGLKSGYLGEGSHTIIPTEARALCDLRMAPGMQVAPTLRALREHLDRHGYPDIEILMDSGYPAARTPLEAPVVQAMIAAYRALGHEPTIQPIEASATPYYLYSDVLGLDFVWGGLGSAGGSHGPDEWCSLSGLRDLARGSAAFLSTFAAAPA
ncbi:MAG: M20/M25/M40 family metallo-hydrolase [Anaerolineales bacterium]|nr:M20/M25/M40 family metallo-hydrolase [Anaerolineales bacterium]